MRHGKTRRMEGAAGMWPAGQMSAPWALGSHVRLKMALEHCWPLLSPSKQLPAPGVYPPECIFNDHETGPAIGMITSFPFPLFGEKP
jgi:hypothetical protein